MPIQIMINDKQVTADHIQQVCDKLLDFCGSVSQFIDSGELAQLIDVKCVLEGVDADFRSSNAQIRDNIRNEQVHADAYRDRLQEVYGDLCSAVLSRFQHLDVNTGRSPGCGP
jgi:hypothetical protein